MVFNFIMSIFIGLFIIVTALMIDEEFKNQYINAFLIAIIAFLIGNSILGFIP